MNIAQRILERKKPFYSFEFFPPREQEQWPAFYETVERLLPLDPLFASVTYGAGGSRPDRHAGYRDRPEKAFRTGNYGASDLRRRDPRTYSGLSLRAA